jgi:hypothetical protein
MEMTFNLSGLEVTEMGLEERDRLQRSSEEDHEATYYYVAKNGEYIEKFKRKKEYRRVKERGWADESYKRTATYVTISI